MPQHAPRGSDYHGQLRRILKNFDYSSLVCELIQNADDANDVSEITFDMRDDALVVDNDGCFSDCGNILGDPEDCSIQAECGYKCDFHRLREVGSGDKRYEEGNTGFFGIGFTAVYKITNQPELISAGHHWIIRDWKVSENRRIEECDGCPECTSDQLPGTRFILPWAYDDPSFEWRRQKLQQPPITDDDIKVFSHEMDEIIPRAMLFLKKINCVKLKRRTELISQLSREKDGSTITIQDRDGKAEWHVLYGEFTAHTIHLDHTHEDFIEPHRSRTVELALSKCLGFNGRLYATLPTFHETRLPFHINAAFFPSTDRSRIKLEDDYESEWNREAIRAAAHCLANNIEAVAQVIGSQDFYRMLGSLQNPSDEFVSAETRLIFGTLWESIESKLAESRIVYTTNQKWVKPSQARLISNKQRTAIPVFQELGMHIVHPDVLSHRHLLESLGVERLDLNDIINGLVQCGLQDRHKLSQDDAPRFLQDKPRRETLWSQLTKLVSSADNQLKQLLKRQSIALGHDGHFWPLNNTKHADSQTIDLFGDLCPETTFLSPALQGEPLFEELCNVYNAEDAIACLRRLSDEETQRIDTEELLAWFQEHLPEISDPALCEGIREEIRNLPIFPSHSGRKRLNDLAVPGNFGDPLKLTTAVDLEQFNDDYRDFLEELKGSALTFDDYVAKYIPDAFRTRNLTSQEKRDVTQFLADNFSKIPSRQDIRNALSELPIVECRDGEFRNPDSVYFRGTASQILGYDIPETSILEQEVDRDQFERLYRWLGVTDTPRYEDILNRISKLKTQLPFEASDGVKQIYKYLAENWDSDIDKDQLRRLKTDEWLPAEGDNKQWYKPSDLYTVSHKELFKFSGVNFLAFPRELQTKAKTFREWLGLKSEPGTKLVIKHLQRSAEHGVPVSNDVYKYLQENANPIDLEQLKGFPCINIDEHGNYIGPEKVFFKEHPFDEYRHTLGDPLRRHFYKLFEDLGVKDRPDAHDAIAVLQEIAEDYENGKSEKQSYHNLVTRCWGMIGQESHNKSTNAAMLTNLKDRPVIPTGDGDTLKPPISVLIDDYPELTRSFIKTHPDLKYLVALNADNEMIPGWRAMLATGASRISSHFERQLYDFHNAEQFHRLTDIFIDRLDEMKRIALYTHDDPEEVEDIFRSIRPYRVSILTVQQTLHLPNQDRAISLEPENASAFINSKNELYFTLSDAKPPWTKIALELSSAVFPKSAKMISLLIEKVLSAESKSQVNQFLNEVDVPMPEARTDSNQLAGHIIDDIGVTPNQSGDLEGRDPKDSPKQVTANNSPTTPEELPQRPNEDNDPGKNPPSRGKDQPSSNPSHSSPASPRPTHVETGREPGQQPPSTKKPNEQPGSGRHEPVPSSSKPSQWNPECEPEEAKINIKDSPPRPASGAKFQQTKARGHTNTGDGRSPDRNQEDDSVDRLHEQGIGEWGERFSLSYLRDYLLEEHPTAVVHQNSLGFYLEEDGHEVARVEWRNVNRDRQEGYDIKLVHLQEERLIEVKATATDNARWFKVERSQWELARLRRSEFEIYRVFNAGNRTHATIKFIKDPVQLWERGELTAYPVQMRV